jgi:hypothetical protein
MTKNNLWVFGDSFSALPKTSADHDLWTEIVSANLIGIKEHKNFAAWGVSNDYIFHLLVENVNSMQMGDYVIIQPTQRHRQWFFDDPELGNYWIKDLNKYVSKEQSTAVEYYTNYLQKDYVDDLRYRQFIMSLERLAQIAEHLRILVLPGFWPVPGVTGALIDICDGEFFDLNNIIKWLDETKGKDPRYNHMSKNNHAILAEKIISFFKDGKVIELNTEFEKGFIQ